MQPVDPPRRRSCAARYSPGWVAASVVALNAGRGTVTVTPGGCPRRR
ncbi:hypothetical protein ACFSEO_02030 [Agromyces cerinus subsp. nitratus]